VQSYIVVYGNLTEGFTFYGPFASYTLAESWAKNSDWINRDSWRILPLVDVRVT
jgi:hypothetical protein